jgi:AICAR transformylase/IMP cyclohydrolase PurH
MDISQDQKGLLQFGMWHCVADFSQKLLAYVIVQSYTPCGVSSNLMNIREF